MIDQLNLYGIRRACFVVKNQSKSSQESAARTKSRTKTALKKAGERENRGKPCNEGTPETGWTLRKRKELKRKSLLLDEQNTRWCSESTRVQDRRHTVLPGAGCLQEPQGQAKGSGFRERGCYRSQKQRASVTTGALIGPGRVAAQARTPERGTTGAKQIGEEEDDQGI